MVAQKLIDLGYKNVFNAIADCCKDPSDAVKGSEKHEGHCENCGHQEGHEGHDHSAEKKEDHSGHNHSEEKKDDHAGHKH